MRFFYWAVSQVNTANGDVLESGNKAEKNDGTEGTEGDAESPGDTDKADNGRISGRVWLDCIRAVSDMTHYDWEKTFRMSVMEFFTFLAYVNYTRRKEEMQIKKLYKKP